MLLLKKNTFEISSDSPIVSSDEAASVAKAEDIVAAANVEAAKIVEDAKKAYEEEKVRGYNDGVERAKQEELGRKMDQVREASAYLTKIEGEMGDLVVKALRKCIAEIGDKELIVQIVRKSMQAIVRAQRQIKVKVSPEMVATVKERMKTILENFPSVAFAEVVEDVHLTGTACVVETDAGSVEASVDGQIDAIEKSIRRQFAKDAK